MIFHKDFTEKKNFYSAKETAKMFGPLFPNDAIQKTGCIPRSNLNTQMLFNVYFPKILIYKFCSIKTPESLIIQG